MELSEWNPEKNISLGRHKGGGGGENYSRCVCKQYPGLGGQQLKTKLRGE